MTTKQTQHTPGPWGTARCAGGELEIRAGATFALAKIYQTKPPFANRADAAREAADARLIAAAPDLLAALERIAEITCDHPAGVTCHREIARAAIARARGEA